MIRKPTTEEREAIDMAVETWRHGTALQKTIATGALYKVAYPLVDVGEMSESLKLAGMIGPGLLMHIAPKKWREEDVVIWWDEERPHFGSEEAPDDALRIPFEMLRDISMRMMNSWAWELGRQLGEGGAR